MFLSGGKNAGLIQNFWQFADYVFREEENARKGIGDVMGEKVLELESERLQGERQQV